MKKEDIIEQLFNSINGIQPVAPSDDLWDKIKTRIQEKSVVPLRYVGLVAASIALLIAVNIILLSLNTSATANSTAVLEQSLTKSNQLY